MAVVEHKVPLTDAGRLARFMGLARWAKIDDLGLVEHIERGLPTRTLDVILKRVDPKGATFKVTDVIPASRWIDSYFGLLAGMSLLCVQPRRQPCTRDTVEFQLIA